MEAAQNSQWNGQPRCVCTVRRLYRLMSSSSKRGIGACAQVEGTRPRVVERLERPGADRPEPPARRLAFADHDAVGVLRGFVRERRDMQAAQHDLRARGPVAIGEA